MNQVDTKRKIVEKKVDSMPNSNNFVTTICDWPSRPPLQKQKEIVKARPISEYKSPAVVKQHVRKFSESPRRVVNLKHFSDLFFNEEIIRKPMVSTPLIKPQLKIKIKKK